MSHPLPDPTLCLAEQDPVVLFAMCLWGEARREPDASLLGVAWTIVNRTRIGGWYGQKGCLKSILLKPKQFSCFNPDDPNLPKSFRPLDHDTQEIWERCWDTAVDMAWLVEDDCAGPFPGVIGYHDQSLDHSPPEWTRSLDLFARIGRMRFYRFRPSSKTGA